MAESGFVRHDYILCFSVSDPGRVRALTELLSGEWQGDEITPTTWEISNDLTPEEMETKLLTLLEEGDFAVYYYLSDSKRIFRVVLS
jgi:hypothetical protein